MRFEEAVITAVAVIANRRYQTVTKALVIIRDRYYECALILNVSLRASLPITVTASFTAHYI